MCGCNFRHQANTVLNCEIHLPSTHPPQLYGKNMSFKLYSTASASSCCLYTPHPTKSSAVGLNLLKKKFTWIFF